MAHENATPLLAPRLQLAWRKATADEIDRTPIMQSDYGAWACDYALVLPLREFDIRREDEDGNDVRSEKTVIFNTQLRGGGGRVPCEGSPTDTPYRDGAHSEWDAEVLGNLPVYVIAPDGTATLKAAALSEDAQ